MRIATTDGQMVSAGSLSTDGLPGVQGAGKGSVELLADVETGERRHQHYAQVAKTNPWVMSSINERASLASRAPLHVFRPQEGGEGRERVRPGDGGPGDGLARLLSLPGVRMSGQRLFRRVAADRLTHGNAFVEFVEDRGQVVGLRWQPWRDVDPLFSTDGLELYGVDVPIRRRGSRSLLESRRGDQTRTISITDGIHLTINEDTEGPLGVSPLESLHATHALHEAAWRFARSYLENGMFPSGVVSLPEKATLQQAELTRELIEQLQTGIERGGKPAVLGFGEWQQVTATPEGAKLVELAKASREEVATAYRMAWLGNVSEMNRATAEQARQAFIRDVVGEDVGVLEVELNAQLVEPGRRWSNAGVFVEAELGELLRPDMEAMANVIQSEVGAPVLTPNEGRELLNRQPLDDRRADRLVLNPGTPAAGGEGGAGAGGLAVPATGDLLKAASGSNGHRGSDA
jgi:HK97 family phage portal protein